MPAKKKTKKSSPKSTYLCEVCGLEVTVSKPCTCSEVCLTCCNQPMTKKSKKSTKK